MPPAWSCTKAQGTLGHVHGEGPQEDKHTKVWKFFEGTFDRHTLAFCFFFAMLNQFVYGLGPNSSIISTIPQNVVSTLFSWGLTSSFIVLLGSTSIVVADPQIIPKSSSAGPRGFQL